MLEKKEKKNRKMGISKMLEWDYAESKWRNNFCLLVIIILVAQGTT